VRLVTVDVLPPDHTAVAGTRGRRAPYTRGVSTRTCGDRVAYSARQTSGAAPFPTAATARWRSVRCPPYHRSVPGVGRARWRLELLRYRGSGGEFKVEACDAQGSCRYRQAPRCPAGSTLANLIKYPLAPVHRTNKQSAFLLTPLVVSANEEA
jgi:hypothetical protein